MDGERRKRISDALLTLTSLADSFAHADDKTVAVVGMQTAALTGAATAITLALLEVADAQKDSGYTRPRVEHIPTNQANRCWVCGDEISLHPENPMQVRSVKVAQILTAGGFLSDTFDVAHKGCRMEYDRERAYDNAVEAMEADGRAFEEEGDGLD